MGMQFTRTSWRALAFASLALVPLGGAIWSEAAILPEPPNAQRPTPNAQSLRYNRDIRPILAENCFPCHGPDSAARKADLRIDQRDTAVAMKAIVPGKPDESEMIRRILADDERDLMPPKKTNKKLKPEQKELIKK